MKRVFPILLIAAFFMPGCGRKLPPMPPAKEDPVVIQSIDTDGESILVMIRINTDNADVSLLGKAQGLCPQCEDDLKTKLTVRAIKGIMTLRDEKPEDQCMVYRILLSKGDMTWSTPARVYCK